MADRTTGASHPRVSGCSCSSCPTAASGEETRYQTDGNFQTTATSNEGMFIMSPTNSSECAHMSTLQSKEPISESQKAQEETGRMKPRRLTSKHVTCSTTLPVELQMWPDFTEVQTQVRPTHCFTI